MQEVGFQLMKSPRELASWNFPLSKILDDYSKLLPEAGKIHYGEAALVIQNSVSAYVRRLEELYDETKCFNKKLFYGQMEKGEKSFLEGGKGPKNVISFEQFKFLAYERDCGKNLDLKFQNKKEVSYLNNCFSQLESLNDRLCITLHDIQDELIGKKYDFRSNQRTSKCGSLVDEFNLKDFENSCTLFHNFIPNFKNSSKVNIPTKKSRTFSYVDSNQSNQDSFFSPTEYVASNSYKCSFIEENSTNESTSVSSSTQHPLIATDTLVLEGSSTCTTAHDSGSSLLQAKGQKTNKDDMNFKLSVDLTDEEDISFYKNNLQRISITDTQKIIKIQDMMEDFKPNMNFRTSGRLKCFSDDFAITDLNKLQPIVFTSGIPYKVMNNRTKFRFPCNRKLLTGNLKLKKRRNCIKTKKSDRILNVDDSHITEEVAFDQKNSNSNSPLGGRIESVRICHEESLCSKENCTVRYNPVTTLKLDLLGFEETSHKNSRFFEQSPAVSCINNIISSSEYLSLSHSTLMTSSASSASSLGQSFIANTCNQVDIFKQHLSCMETKMKEKIKALYKELDLLTDEDKKIAKWHEEIKPKLVEAERKPPFFIHEYESRILQKLEKSNRRLDFNDIVREESFCEIPRFFSATLQLASTNNLDINPNKGLQKGIELVLLD